MFEDTASQPDSKIDHGPSLQYLTFALGDEVFAMDIRSVREIIQYGSMTKVPLMPDFVRGILNLRGAVVPVIDLQARLGGNSADTGKKSCIVIYESTQGDERTDLGLQVDAVNEVIDIAQADVVPAPAFGSTIDRHFIHGIGKVRGEFIVILEPSRALDIEELAHLAEVHPH